MANIIVICGPQAVGKMTVGEALRDRLGYCLMLNHDYMDVAERIFGRSTPASGELMNTIRGRAFELSIMHDIDMIFTHMCVFDRESSVGLLHSLHDMYTDSGGEFYLVELKAELDERLRRNRTEHRLDMKHVKRNIEESEDTLLKMEAHKLNTEDGETLFAHHIKIDNTFLSPDEVADKIIAAFGLNQKKSGG